MVAPGRLHRSRPHRPVAPRRISPADSDQACASKVARASAFNGVQMLTELLAWLPVLNIIVVPAAGWIIRYLWRVERRLLRIEVHLGINGD